MGPFQTTVLASLMIAAYLSAVTNIHAFPTVGFTRLDNLLVASSYITKIIPTVGVRR